MRLLSLNVGEPRLIDTPRGDILTSIFKEPVSGRRKVIPHNIEGDRQSDLTVHGGPDKAIYAYSQNHYPYWSEALPGYSLSPGNFGENLTVEDLLEEHIHIGDIIQAGSSRLRATQPRMPCFKLALRFNRPDMVKLFWKSDRPGVYFAIEQPGELGAGDEIRIIERNPLAVSVMDVVRAYKGEITDPDLLNQILASPLSQGLKEDIRERVSAR